MDRIITAWLNGPAGGNALLDFIFTEASHVGVPLLIIIVLINWWSRHERPHVRHTCVAAGLSFFLGLGINQLILIFVHRLRPYDVGATHLIVGPSGDWSFPSDHSTATFAIAAAFLFHGLRRRGLTLLFAAFLVSVSRIYIGTHYVSDVLGGAATGILAAGVVRASFREGTRLDRFIVRIL